MIISAEELVSDLKKGNFNRWKTIGFKPAIQQIFDHLGKEETIDLLFCEFDRFIEGSRVLSQEAIDFMQKIEPIYAYELELKMYIETDGYKEAIESIRKNCQRFSDNSYCGSMLYHIGKNILDKYGAFNAREWFEEVIKNKFSTSVNDWMNYGVALCDSVNKKYRSANRTLKPLLNSVHEGCRACAYQLLARNYLVKGRRHAALRVYEGYLKELEGKDGNAADLYIEMSKRCEKLRNKRSEVLEFWEKGEVM